MNQSKYHYGFGLSDKFKDIFKTSKEINDTHREKNFYIYGLILRFFKTS